MTIARLKKFLVEKGVDPQTYCIGPDCHADETYRLCCNQDGRWEVYFSERGNKNCLQTLNSETEATKAFWDFIKVDESIYR